ncbi:hypothetical protein [Vacuolonema iberomarrocanum]|uniref:hypothetical protein n=1 Tax=Vacuolonema iberomarrocanum TaxID=3454632 RepID=UPI0019DAA0AA|nr:hypothetical protein [filamentous cyanobacterium LEGE 07170]
MFVSAALDLTGDLSIKQGATYRLRTRFRQESGVPLDLTGAIPRAQLRESPSATLAATFTATVSDAANGEVLLELSPTQTTALTSGKYVWDLFIDMPSGDTFSPLGGKAQVDSAITRNA